jgi:PREDICTED: similar to DNA mismatch repair protein muts
VTLKNLEIFENSVGSVEGTLFETLDYCSTKFGKRMLRLWICSPLCNVDRINERLDAIEDIMKPEVFCEVDRVMKLLSKLPDLERILSKIHTQGCSKRSQSHPDSRAVLFDNDTYSKRKILDFLSVIDGFKKSFEIRASLATLSSHFSSSLLKKCTQFAPNGDFPDVKSILDHYDKSFDHNLAKKEGRIIPKDGVDPEYDQSLKDLASIEKQFEKYRLEECKKLNCKVGYCNSGKNRYQLEIPDHAAKRVGEEYMYTGQRKGFKRFHTNEVKQMLTELTAAEEKKEKLLQDTMRRLFESFDKNYHHWISIIRCISLIDCLISLAECTKSIKKNGSSVSRPKFESNVEKPFIDIKQGKHPCLLKFTSNFIPNDFYLEKELLLLTGPNMGGKSTLMRQTGLIAIMAQIGCYVPAESCSMTLIDRIFTRLGAYDRIMEGESTFFVELSETSIILKHASNHSLVLLDELGRGTSTYDGTAIAAAVVQELIANINCRTIFSTHYHSLVDYFSKSSNIKYGHMVSNVYCLCNAQLIHNFILLLFCKTKTGMHD